MGINRSRILLYSTVHFLVDFACAFLLYQKVYGTEHWYLIILIYNFCAFALQMPLGLLADRWNRNALCAALGCLLVALAFGVSRFRSPVLCAVTAGIGNGLFHVGGGIDVLNISREKSSALGIFVSPGALGIYLGTVMGKQNSIQGFPIILILLASAFCICVVQYIPHRSFLSDNKPLSFDGIGSTSVLAAIACLFLVVCLRSYVGMTLDFSWKGQNNWGIVLVLAVIFGKMAGGIFADRFGALKASGISLGIAAILFLLSANPLAGVGAVFLFNMTMPITLWAVARLLPGSKGFSFGLLTFGLFLGFTPVYLGAGPLLSSAAALSLAAVGSFVLLWVGLRKAVL